MATKKKQRRVHSEATKAAAVGALDRGDTEAHIKKQFGVSRAQVYKWRAAGVRSGPPFRLEDALPAATNGIPQERRRTFVENPADAVSFFRRRERIMASLASALGDFVRLIVESEMAKQDELLLARLRVKLDQREAASS